MHSLTKLVTQQAPDPDEVWDMFITCYNYYGSFDKVSLVLLRHIAVALSRSTHPKAHARFQFAMDVIRNVRDVKSKEDFKATTEFGLDPDAAFKIASQFNIQYKDANHVAKWVERYEDCFLPGFARQRFRLGFLQQLVKARKWQQVRYWLKMIQSAAGDGKPSEDMLHEVFRIIINEYALISQRKAALEGTDAKALKDLRHETEDASRLLKDMMDWHLSKGGSVPLRLANEWVTTLDWRVGGHIAAMRIVRWMEGNGINPDSTTFNTMLTHIIDRDNVFPAEKLLDEMKARNIQPDAITYRHMIDLHIKLHQPLAAYQYYVSNPSLQREILTWNDTDLYFARRFALSLLEDQPTTAPLEPAIHVLSDIISLTTATVTPIWAHHILIHRLVSQNRLDDATRHLFRIFGWKYWKGSRPHPSNTYNFPALPPQEKRTHLHETHAKSIMLLIQTYAATPATFHTGLELFRILLLKGIEPDLKTYTALVLCALKGQETGVAETLLEHLKRETKLKPDAVFYTALFRYYIRNCAFGKAQGVLGDMIGDGMEVPRGVWVALVRSLLENGRVEDAGRIERERLGEREGWGVDELAVLVAAMVKSGDLKGVREVLDVVMRRLQSGEGVEGVGVGFVKPLVEGFVALGKVGTGEEVLRMCEGMFGKGGGRRKGVLAGVWDVVVSSYLDAGMLADAERVLMDGSVESGSSVGSLTDVAFIRYFGRQKSWDVVETWVADIVSRNDFGRIENGFVECVRCAREQREWDLIGEFWRRLCEERERMGARRFRSFVYATVMSAFATARKYGSAKEVLEMARRDFAGVEEMPLDLRHAAMNVYAKMGMVEEMEGEMREVLKVVGRGDGGKKEGGEEGGWDVLTARGYGVMLDGYGRAGDWKKSLEMFGRMWKHGGIVIEEGEGGDEGEVKKSGNVDKEYVEDPLTTYHAPSLSVSPTDMDIEVDISSPSLTQNPVTLLGSTTNTPLLKSHGVLPLHISLILDALGFAHRKIELRTLWSSVKASGYPLTENCYTSYIEALVRCGECEDAVRVLREEMWEDGIAVGEKTVRNLKGLLEWRGRRDLVGVVDEWVKGDEDGCQKGLGEVEVEVNGGGSEKQAVVGNKSRSRKSMVVDTL
ncbi:hypothetical protein HDV00_005301 [Rhizophlyctis rosea]|nr:hypothetical protein HDV00_005301 [Rhizophlyctis rosea]